MFNRSYPWAARLLLLSILAWISLLSEAQAHDVRVEILNARSSVVIGSSTPATLRDASGQQQLGSIPAMTPVRVSPSREGVIVDQVTHPVVWIRPQGDGLVAVNGRWYQGELILVGRGSILAVNQVDIEDYVASVVQAEMGASFSAEALKAQAIAARSYVLYHRNRVSPWFDVHSDTRSQVYRGLPVSIPVSLATRDTQGIVLMHGGSLINAMYSASSGGRTVGVQGFPYLQSVPDITSRPKYGHGIGMTQWGAQERALQGWNFAQILNHYYRGIRMARLPQ